MQNHERPTFAETTASNLELVLGGRGLQIAGLISVGTTDLTDRVAVLLALGIVA